MPNCEIFLSFLNEEGLLNVMKFMLVLFSITIVPAQWYFLTDDVKTSPTVNITGVLLVIPKISHPSLLLTYIQYSLIISIGILSICVWVGKRFVNKESELTHERPLGVPNDPISQENRDDDTSEGP